MYGLLWLFCMMIMSDLFISNLFQLRYSPKSEEDIERIIQRDYYLSMIKIPPDFVVQETSCNSALRSLLELPDPDDDRYNFLYNISDTNAAGHEDIENVVSCTSSSSSSSGEDSDYFVDEDASSNEASESESAQKSQRSS